MSSAQEILFGSDPTEGIVAVEPGPQTMRVYRREGDRVTWEDRPFRRWMLCTEQHPLPDAIWTELDGEGFRFLAEFPDRDSFETARYWIRDAHASHILLPTAAKQYLTRSGQTLFKGMAFHGIHRMQLDIETTSLHPDKPENEILLIAITDNRGFERIILGDEPSMLREMVTVIRERDPDVIEGHNINEFDFCYLDARARMRGVRLELGRDGSELTFSHRQTCAIGYFSRPLIPAHIHGRQVIDTLFTAQRFDVGKGLFTSHSLKAVAQVLDIAEDGREIVPHHEIASEFRTNPERVKLYALQDVRETRSLGEIVCPPEFYVTQMAPDTYGRVSITGTGEKINSILIREYLRQGRAIPRQAEPSPLPGGYTEVCRTGVIEKIVKCDVESLYPSIMLTRGIKPESDTLDVFLPALRELTSRRISAKKKAKETEGRESAYWDGLQSAFKIMINSFYGYLAGPFNFNDYRAAAQVTTTGQEIVKQIVSELERTGSTVIEVDTDGVYFQPPDGVENESDELEYIESVGSTLPEGIRLAHDGRYKAMISLKMKNYVLATYSGRSIFRGSALRSRADERFGADFIYKAAEHLLRGEKREVRELYDATAARIMAGELPLDKITRRERITEKTFSSASKKRMADAVRESKIGDYVTVYNRRDGTVALAKDYANDEDRDYLLDKLYKFASRLREGFGEDFDTLIARPSPMSRAEAAGQQTLGFDL